jgi:hypothetical protein
MHAHFERTGPLTELTSYPEWAQDLVTACAATKQGVVDHEAWTLMREARLDAVGTRDFMVGVWPVIERFPGYMALNLLKTRYGRSKGENMARRWLVRNIRVEQNHAEYWLNWAEGAGVPQDEVLNGAAPYGTEALHSWCEEVSRSGPLAAGRRSMKAWPMPKASPRRSGRIACVGFSFTRLMMILTHGRRLRSYAPWWGPPPAQTRWHTCRSASNGVT